MGFADGPIPVFVSIVPQKYIVQQIGKDMVAVKVMVEPGASPATYEPKPMQMAALSATRAYFAVGVPFEKMWLKKIASANPDMKIVNTDQGIEKIAMPAHHHEEEEDVHNEEDHHHEEGGMDPHIWLSPNLVKIQAETILKSLKELDPGNASVYDANYASFIADTEALDARLKKMFESKKDKHFMVFHPSWGYFARDYGLIQIAAEIEGKDPKPAMLKELIEHAVQKNIKVIFVQPQFSTKSASILAHEINGRVIFADPLSENWKNNLIETAEKFADAVK